MGTSNYSNTRNSTKPSPFINIEKLVPHNILEILQQATVRLKSQAPKVFDARDFFYAIRSGDDVHRLAEIIGEKRNSPRQPTVRVKFFNFSSSVRI
jgi:hypothetical protein